MARVKAIIIIVFISFFHFTVSHCGSDVVPPASPDSSSLDGKGNDPMTPPDIIGETTPDYVTPDLPPPATGSISGKVYSPESGNPLIENFPVSGALVYVTKDAPPPIPDGAYCHECIEIPETTPHAFSAPDGSFQIDHIPEGTWTLVVQKGEFRKLSLITVTGNTVTPIDRAQTTFPNIHMPPNDYTPRMAIALGSFDIMEDIVSKMGLCPLGPDYHWSGEPCDHVDMFDNGGADWGTSVPPFRDLLNDLNWMLQYHIIFVPCSGSTTDDALYDDQVKENIRQYVRAGGKWYVADWSYDFVEQVFPDFIDFEGDDHEIGAADWLSESFDASGRAVDEDLKDWLSAIGEPADSILFEENWDCIVSLGTVPGTDPDGNPISITPYIWAEGPVTRSNDCTATREEMAPFTITFPYGCGKVLYTTYHTVGAMGGEGRPELITQEKILFYLILEIGICTEPVDPVI